MSLLPLLDQAQNGQYFAAVAAKAGLTEPKVRRAITEIGPEIAEQLYARAEKDPAAFENLLDLLEDTENGADLEDKEAMTGREALNDGQDVLASLYGSFDAALRKFSALTPEISPEGLKLLAPLTATAVLAVLAQQFQSLSHHEGLENSAVPLAGAAPARQSSGFLGTLFSAVVQGLVQGAVKQIAPRRRRRRYGNYFNSSRQRTTQKRRRSRQPSLQDIFGQILKNR